MTNVSFSVKCNILATLLGRYMQLNTSKVTAVTAVTANVFLLLNINPSRTSLYHQGADTPNDQREACNRQPVVYWVRND